MKYKVFMLLFHVMSCQCILLYACDRGSACHSYIDNCLNILVLYYNYVLFIHVPHLNCDLYHNYDNINVIVFAAILFFFKICFYFCQSLKIFLSNVF